jgi:ribosome-binding factor A
MSVRTDQVASVLRKAVQESITRGLQDPRVRGLVSVTNVEVAPDLADAVVYVSVLPAEHGRLTLHGLRSAAGRIQADVNRAVRMRRVPRLSFRLDESMKKEAAVAAAIRRATEEIESSRPAHSDEESRREEHE